MLYRLAKCVIDYPKTSLTLIVAGTLAAATAIPRTEFDSSIRSFIMKDDKDYALYNQYKQAFGQDDILVVAFEAEDVFARDCLQSIQRLTDRLQQVDNVFDVRSLANSEYMKGTEDSFEGVPLVKSADDPKEVLENSRSIAIRDELFRQDLVSPDSRKTAIIVTLRAVPEQVRVHEKEIQAIEKIVAAESQATGRRMYVIGEQFLDLRFLRYIDRDLRLFIPVTYLVVGALLFFGFRNWRYTAIGFSTVLLCQTWIAALIPLTGRKMNSVNAGLPSLILCIALTEAVHWIHGYRKMRSQIPDRKAAMQETMKQLIVPSFLTVLAAGAGFASLVTNDVVPIRDFGLLATLGLLMGFVVMLMTLPSLIVLCGEKTEGHVEDKELIPSRWFVALSDLMFRRPKMMWAVSLLLIAVSAVGIGLIRVEIDRTRYLKRSSDVYQSLNFVDTHLVGTTQLDVWLETGTPDAIKDPAVLLQIEGLAQFLRAQPEIAKGGKVLSLCDFLKSMNKAFYGDRRESYVLPDTREKVAQFLLMYSMSGRKNELDKYVDYPYSRTRISVRTAEHNSSKQDALIDRINGYLKARLDPALHARVASVAVANSNVFHYLVGGMISGCWQSFLMVGLIILLSFRSFRVGIVGMISDVAPSVVSLGLLGWLGIPLEVATAMIFSIALGIAVDGTIHFLARYRLELRRLGDVRKAMDEAFERVGSSMVESTLVVCAGFLVACLSSLRMNIMFGSLSAAVMLIALACDLTLLPLCMLAFHLFERKPKPGCETP